MKTLTLLVVLCAVVSSAPAQRFPGGRPANRPDAQGVSRTWSKLGRPELLRELRKGGFVIVFRHGATIWSQADQLPIRDWSDRSKQRPLSDLGKRQAKEMGETFRALRIPVGIVRSSPYFRTREFAQIAFGKAEPTFGLLDGRREEFSRLFRERPTPGTNTIFSSHQLPLINLGYFKTNELEEGSCGVFRGDGRGGMELIAHLNGTDWKALQSAR